MPGAAVTRYSDVSAPQMRSAEFQTDTRGFMCVRLRGKSFPPMVGSMLALVLAVKSSETFSLRR